MQLFRIGILFLSIIFLSSCDTKTIYKAHEDIKDGLWYIADTPSFKVEVRDTMQQFHLYYLIRNSIDYPYYNLYLTHRLYDPDGNFISGNLEEIYLSDETTGKPFGNGLGDLFDHKIRFRKNFTFPKPGIYTISVSQTMRQNPLPSIISVGLSVEKTGQK
jgi:gliding motility-associated lipoprotein GldH